MFGAVNRLFCNGWRTIWHTETTALYCRQGAAFDGIYHTKTAHLNIDKWRPRVARFTQGLAARVLTIVNIQNLIKPNIQTENC
jgi:hypothetical protein